ncbi:28497_t:CDS:2, partial [Gigaspora margarita]
MCRKAVLKPQDVGTSAIAGASTSDMSIFSDNVVSKPHDVSTSAMAGLISDISISKDFDPTWIKSVEQEIREEFYERRIRES